MEKPKDPKKEAKRLARKMYCYQWAPGVEHATSPQYRDACRSAMVCVDEISKIKKDDFWNDVKRHLKRLIEGKE